MRQKENGEVCRIYSIILNDTEATPLGNEPVYQDGTIIGKTTSAAFGYRVGSPIALADLDVRTHGDPTSTIFEIDIAGERFGGRVFAGAVFDPSGTRMRTASR